MFLHITISQKTGGKTNICREIKTDYKEAKRLDDLPKVTVSHRQTKHKGRSARGFEPLLLWN